MMTGFDFDGAVAVLTGAGSGMGAASAHSFAERGAMVVVTDIDRERAETVAAEIGEAAVPLRCDVTRIADLEAARDVALERFGHVDLVMNNVGIIAMGAVEDIPLEAWERVVDVNLMSIVRSNLVFLPGLLAQGSGYLVNTASTAGLFAYGFDRLPYTATKHAVVGLSESLAVYLRPRGIGVSCLCPAGVRTRVGESITFYGAPTRPHSPDFRLSDPEEVGEEVAEAVAAGRFLILTAPEVDGALQEHWADVDAYITRTVAEIADAS